MQSGRQDSNLRPPGPKPGALAKLSYAPDTLSISAEQPAGQAQGEEGAKIGARPALGTIRHALGGAMGLNAR